MPEETSAGAVIKRLAEVEEHHAAERARSAKRLHEITEGNLAPRTRVTNHASAFASHLLAMGVVGGMKAARRECGPDRHGPRVPGIVYSHELGRFHAAHSVLTYANSRFGSPLTVHSGTVPEEPFAVKLFSSDPSASSVGGAVATGNPATRVLAFDFDRKEHGHEVVREEVIGLCGVLHEAGLYNWIVDVSSGGYHVLLMLNRPVRLSDVAPLFEAIRPAFRTLDIQPMTSPHGAISVPFSAGKVPGTRRLLAHALNPAFTEQSRANRITGWEAISSRLLTGLRDYDRKHLHALTFDQRAAALSAAATEMWAASVGSRPRSSSRRGRDPKAMELDRLEAMKGRTYASPSEERFAIAGAMQAIYGLGDDDLSFAASRLIGSTEPMPRRYRELVAKGSGRLSASKAAAKDLASAREKSDLPRGWTGFANGSTYRSVSSSAEIEFTPEARGLAGSIVEATESGHLTYAQLAVLRAYLQFGNARHHEHLRAAETGARDVPEDPFTTPVPFALSMVTRMTGLAHRTAYDRTMACTKAGEGDEAVTACRAAGAARGLFCLCHEQWEPFFRVAHLGHSGDSDEGGRSDECRDHAYCSRPDCEGRARSSSYVLLHSPGTEADTSSWVWRYLSSRDPIFNECALGAAGFHFHDLVSRAEGTVYLSSLEEAKLRGRSVPPVVAQLIEAGLLGRSAARGRKANLTANPVERGSLAYRLHHERRLHSVHQQAGFRSAMMGTGDITSFVLGFADDPRRLHTLARMVLNYQQRRAEHAPAALTAPDGHPVRTVKEFCLAHGIPAPKEDAERLIGGVISSAFVRPDDEHNLGYGEDDAEVWDGESLLERVHWRDDFVSAIGVMEYFESRALGSDFTPSALLAQMFEDRRRAFILTQECLMETVQLSEPDEQVALLAA